MWFPRRTTHAARVLFTSKIPYCAFVTWAARGLSWTVSSPDIFTNLACRARHSSDYEVRKPFRHRARVCEFDLSSVYWNSRRDRLESGIMIFHNNNRRKKRTHTRVWVARTVSSVLHGNENRTVHIMTCRRADG